MSRLVRVVVVACWLVAGGWPLPPSPAHGVSLGMITSPAELAALPMSGAAWDRMKAAADGSLGTPKIADFNSNHDVLTLAVALVYGRTGIQSYRSKAADAIMSAIGTEDGGQAVMLGRNLISYVLAADLIDFASFDPARDAQFRSWLSAVRFEVFSDGSIVSEDRKRANNHGRVAGASRLAASLYLGDGADLAEAIAIFKGWLGDKSSYNGFTWNNDLSWQADPANPVGVNPVGATKNGFSIDGALPEEMRRGCSFKVPPCPTTYPWGAFQAVLLVGEILNRQGYDVWGWQDRALPRAARFVHDLDVAYGGWWAKGDDVWQPWLINHAYGTSYPTLPVTVVGKTFGWSDWLWGPGSGGGGGGNTAPTCSNLSLTVAQDSTGGDVAPSCSDANSDPLTYGIVTQGGKGVASVTGSGTVPDPYKLHYVPDSGQFGPDSFTYKANDGTVDSTPPATVNVTITPSGGGGIPVSVSPVADTYVRSDSPTKANGSALTLRSRGGGTLHINSYLRFVVTGVGAARSATLRLYVSDASADAGTLYRVASNSWSESMLYGGQPLIGTAIRDLGPVAAGGYRDFDVSGYVTGDGTYSFALLGENNDVAQFHSREGANDPLLVVTPG